MKSRFQIAKSDIEHHFDQLPERVFRQKDIARHLTENRAFWRLAQSTTVSDFIKFLISSRKLREIIFPFPKPYKREIRYAWGKVDLFTVMMTLKPGCYFSHYSAMKFHGLTEQLPKTVYLNDEQLNASVSTGELTQKAIDLAFGRKPRTTSHVAETKDFRVCIITGKNTGRLGVVEERADIDGGNSPGTYRFTNLERTLIDIAVRPVYAGGVFEVRKAYELASDKLSVNRLAAMLQKLRYTYPYHQTIGYYLDRAGYKPALLDLLRRFPMDFDFYLAHGMKDPQYVKEWRLHIPKGF